VLSWVKTWHCGQTLRWVFILSVGVFSLSFVGTWTYLALSALAEAIEPWNVFAVIVLLIFIGFCVFMNPLMPGPVVYLLCGVVITGKFCSLGRASSDEPCSTGMLWLGFAVAALACLLTKLAAVCGQMLIGRTSGSNVSVLRMVGVETPLMRAIEWTLTRPGMSSGKVYVLCGGPDWPTSVLCGILGCGFGQICLGTLPMGIFLLPSAFAGAVLNMSDGVWKSMAALVLVFALVSQVALGLLAIGAVSDYLSSEDPEVKKFLYDEREEHKKILEMNKQQEAFDRALVFYTTWSAMNGCQKATLVVAVVLSWLAAAASSLITSRLWRPFQIISRISQPYDHDPPGLDGKWHTIIHPLGWAVTGLTVVGIVCFYVWGSVSAGIAKDHVDEFRELSPDEKKMSAMSAKHDDAAFEDSKSVADDANGADWPKSEGRKSDGKIIDDDAPDDAMTAVSQNSQKKEL
jgi:hypothetical protein